MAQITVTRTRSPGLTAGAARRQCLSLSEAGLRLTGGRAACGHIFHGDGACNLKGRRPEPRDAAFMDCNSRRHGFKLLAVTGHPLVPSLNSRAREDKKNRGCSLGLDQIIMGRGFFELTSCLITVAIGRGQRQEHILFIFKCGWVRTCKFIKPFRTQRVVRFRSRISR
jgi:hypothetical protein